MVENGSSIRPPPSLSNCLTPRRLLLPVSSAAYPSPAAAQVLAKVGAAVAKSIINEMLPKIASAILTQMDAPAAVKIFDQTNGDEDYARMFVILNLMGNDPPANAPAATGSTADAVTEAGAGAPAGEAIRHLHRCAKRGGRSR